MGIAALPQGRTGRHAASMAEEDSMADASNDSWFE
jgi:hypothetical protein